jgi:hypothetical protein
MFWSFVKRMLMALAVLVIPASSAIACPPGTVFSGYKGNGYCAIIGKGKQSAAQCTIKKGACPAGTKRQHSNHDPKNDYCCPTTSRFTKAPKVVQKPNWNESCSWFGTAPYCKGRCPRGYYSKGPVSKRGDGEPCWTGYKVYCCHNTITGPGR